MPLSDNRPLFRVLALLGGSRAAIDSFTTKYGKLGLAHETQRTVALESKAMRAAVEIADAVTAKSAKRLRLKFTLVGDSSSARFVPVRALELVPPRPVRPGERLDDVLLETARAHLVVLVNAKLDQHVTQEVRADLVMAAKPRNVLGRAWLQLGQSLVQARADGVCTVCGDAFVMERSGALYCSPACKQAQWRLEHGGKPRQRRRGSPLPVARPRS